MLTNNILLVSFINGLIGMIVGLYIAQIHQHEWEEEYTNQGHWTVYRCKTCWKLKFQAQPLDKEILREERMKIKNGQDIH